MESKMVEKRLQKLIIDSVIEALKQIQSPRFFQTERGFQGRFTCALYKVFDAKNILPDDTIIEEEHQKRIKFHRTRLRPDLIIHVPIKFGRSGSRTENNFVVFAFKKQANEDKVKKDLEKLNELFEKLGYQLGIFINIGGLKSFLYKYSGPFKTRVHEFCITQTNSKLNISHAYFRGDKIEIEKFEDEK